MTGYIFPLLLLLLLLWSLLRRVDILEAFLQGAREGLRLLGQVLPAMAVMLMMTSLLEASGLTKDLVRLLSPLCQRLGLDSRLVPLLLLRPVSGSASSAAAAQLYAQHGPDSPVGYLAGVLLSSMETVFYTLTVYFGAAQVRRARYAAPAALLITLLAGFAALAIGSWLYTE